MTAALSEPLGLAHCIFDGVRSCGSQARGFTSHFHQALSDVHSFANQGVFVVPFHRFLLSLRCYHIATTCAASVPRESLGVRRLMQRSQPTPLPRLSVPLNQLFDSCSLPRLFSFSC